MTSTASRTIVDWIVAVPVAVAPEPPAAPPQLPAPVPDERVMARARELYQPPHYVTRQERERIEAELNRVG